MTTGQPRAQRTRPLEPSGASARPWAGPRRGAAATELALVLPFIALIFCVAADFCRVYYYTQTVENCAYAGTLYASNNAKPLISTMLGTLVDRQPFRNAAAIQAAVNEGSTLNPPLTSSGVQVSVASGVATVTVTYDCQLITPVLAPATSIQIRRQVSMTVTP